MTDQTINLENLTPGTVVELVAVTVRLVDRDGRVHVDLPDGGMFWVNPGSLARIISRSETDADKIARLEAELAERDARIADLELLRDRAVKVADALNMKRTSDVIDGTTSPAPVVLDPDVVSQFCAGIEPTRWSKPIEGPPPKGLPGGSYQIEALIPHKRWYAHTVPSDNFDGNPYVPRHRIAMNTPITWEGGECPVPGDWEFTIALPGPNGRTRYNVLAGTVDWSGPFTFTLTSDGREVR